MSRTYNVIYNVTFACFGHVMTHLVGQVTDRLWFESAQRRVCISRQLIVVSRCDLLVTAFVLPLVLSTCGACVVQNADA